MIHHHWNYVKLVQIWGVVNFQRFVIGDKLRGDQSEGWGMAE